MTTSGELIERAIDRHAAAIERLGDKAVEAAEIMAIPVGLAAVALNNVASALYSQPRRPAGVRDNPEWPERTPGRHTTTVAQ